MPLAPTTYMLLIRPTPGGDDDVWDDLLNTLNARVDLHDHTTNLGKAVPSAGINIDATLPFNGFSITTAAGLGLTGVAALAAGSRIVYSETASGDLYYRNPGGSNVQLTNGNTLALTTVGGIGGDYTTFGAEVAFVNATDSYTFKQQTGAGVRQYAKLEAADLLIYEYKANPAGAPPTNAVTLKSPLALAAGYALTFPAALPGSTLLRQVTSGGVETFSNTIASAATFSGLITANAGLTAAAGQNITISGAGEVKHGDRIRTYNGSGIVIGSGLTPGGSAMSSTGAALGWLMLPFDVGDRVKSVNVALIGNGVTDVTIDVRTMAASTGVNASIGSVAVVNAPATWGDFPVNNTDTTVTDSLALYIEFTISASGMSIGNIRVTYDRP